MKNNSPFIFSVSALLSLSGLLTQNIALADVPLEKGEAVATKQICHVKCSEPHAACEESQKVIETLEHLTKVLNDGDFATLGEYMDEHVTTFDTTSKKTICGKEAVIAAMKKRYDQSVAESGGGTVSYHIEKPYAKVTGDYATVTFLITKTVTGARNNASAKSAVFQSHSTDIFVKHDGKWKKLHYVSNWKKIS